MKKGFTLLELIIVVIVIGILAAVALPRFISVSERARAAEGIGVLDTMRAAQVRYYSQYGAYRVVAGCTGLDVTTTAPQNFASPTCLGGVGGGNIVTISRTNGYILGITENGVISCADGSIPCPAL